MRRHHLPLSFAVALLLFTAAAQSPAGAMRAATVTLERRGDAGTLQIELLPEDVWQRDLFVSLYRGEFRERKGIRPADDGSYRIDVEVPEPGEWGIYLRYGVAQAGYAGYGTLQVPAEGGSSSTTVRLASGFAGDVPAFVQPLGFALFGVIALATLIGLRALLQRIRRSQRINPVAADPNFLL